MAEYRSKYTGAEVDALLDKIAEDNVGDIDSVLSLESENPVMNKILTARFNGIDTRIDSLPTKLSQFTDDVVAGKYLPLSGGTISGGSGALEIKRNGPYLSNIKFSNTDGKLGELGFIWKNAPAFFHTDGNYYHLLHSGNIGSQNAGSATKLETARTIWGQSFDGMGDVSGNITLGTASIRGYDNRNILESTANDLVIGYGYMASSLKTTIWGNTIKLNDAVFINSSGNVTISGSDLAGTNYKLYVDGAINTTGTIYLYGGYLSLRPTTKVYGDIEMTSSLMRFQAIHDGVAFLPIALNPNGGYVGIGTTNPQYKLDVNGDAHISGNLIVDGTITPSTASASYSLRGGTSNKTVVIIEVGSTEETIEHGLGADVAVSLYARDTTKEDSWVLTSNGDIEITDTAVIVTFDNPTIVEYKVVIVG